MEGYVTVLAKMESVAHLARLNALLLHSVRWPQ